MPFHHSSPRLRARSTGRPRNTGFTIPELIVVLAIASVLALLAIPGLVSSSRLNAADAAANQLVAVFAMARSEAIKLGVPVSVSSSNSTSDWSGGWSACAGSPGVGGGPPSFPAFPCPTTAATGAIRVMPAAVTPLKVYGATSAITFDPTGRLTGSGVSYTSEFDFMVCSDGSTPTAPMSLGVTVMASGRARVADTNSANIPQNNSAKAMACTVSPAG